MKILTYILLVLLVLFVFYGNYCAHQNKEIEKQDITMEVYRGNTKLQYIIVDSAKVDSCVIFLNK